MHKQSGFVSFMVRIVQIRYFSCGFLCFIVLFSIVGPWVSSYDLHSVDFYRMRESPSSLHWLGTDDVGRDVLIRLCYAGRVSLFVATCTMMLQLLFGSIIGCIMGYLGGWTDRVLSYFIDIVMCFPFFILAFAMTSVLGAGLVNLILIISLLSWPKTARILRSEVMKLRHSDYILCAKATGLNHFEIVIVHILPNIMPHLIVAITLAMANAILLETALSYLGLGIRPPLPSWGNMLITAQSMTVLKYEWWLWLPPGVLLILSVLAINCLGDGLCQLRDAKRSYIS